MKSIESLPADFPTSEEFREMVKVCNLRDPANCGKSESYISDVDEKDAIEFALVLKRASKLRRK